SPFTAFLTGESEAEFQRKLNLPRSAGTQSPSESVEDFSEARSTERGIRLSERRMVKDIEEFDAELEVARFAEICLLQRGEVHIPEIRPVDGVAAAIAKRPRGRHGERRGVKPVANRLWTRIRVNANDAVWPLVDEIAVPESVRPDIDGIGDACPQNS